MENEMFGYLIEKNFIPYYLKQLYISLPNYKAEIHLVSRSIGGKCLGKRMLVDPSNQPYKRDVYLYLVGAFVGKEIAPRFLMLREDDRLYSSIYSFYHSETYNSKYSDYVFKRGVKETYWRLRI